MRRSWASKRSTVWPATQRRVALDASVTPSNPVLFESERLIMRLWSVDEAKAFFRIWGDPRVIFWGGHASSPDDCRAAILRLAARCDGYPGHGWFSVARRSDSESVGNVVLQPAPFAPGVTEIGWHFEYDVWGRGFATEAATATLRHAFDVLALPRVLAAVLPDNARSRRVTEKIGMRRIGSVTHAGMPHDLFESRG